MERIVKPVVGFPGYLVSNYGEVYSTWTVGPGSHIGGPPRRLRASKSGERWSLGLTKDGKRHTARIHTLVLTAFGGKRPDGMEACHFPDRDTSNNRLDNLRWDTKKSNQADKVAHCTTNDGENNGSAKLTEKQVIRILRMRGSGSTYKEMSLLFGVSLSNIQMICNGSTWKIIDRGK